MNKLVFLKKPNSKLLEGEKRLISPGEIYFLSPSQEWARPYIDEMIREKVITSDRDGVLGIHQENPNKPGVELTIPSQSEIITFQKKHIRSLEEGLKHPNTSSEKAYSKTIQGFKTNDYATILIEYSRYKNPVRKKDTGISSRPLYQLIKTIYAKLKG